MVKHRGSSRPTHDHASGSGKHNKNPGAHRVDGLNIDNYNARQYVRLGRILRQHGIVSAEDLVSTKPADLIGLIGPRQASAIRIAADRRIDEVIDLVFPPDTSPDHSGSALCANCGRWQPEESFMNPRSGVRGSVCTPCRMSAINAARTHYQIPDDDPSHANGDVVAIHPSTLEPEPAPEPEPEVALRVCAWCKEPKPIDDFWVDRKRHDGRRLECRACGQRRRDELARQRLEEPVSIVIPRANGQIRHAAVHLTQPTHEEERTTPRPTPATREDALALAYLIVEADQKIKDAQARVDMAEGQLMVARNERDAAVASRDQALQMLQSKE